MVQTAPCVYVHAQSSLIGILLTGNKLEEEEEESPYNQDAWHHIEIS